MKIMLLTVFFALTFPSGVRANNPQVETQPQYKDHFTFFPSEEKAVEYFRHYEQELLAPQRGDTPRQIIAFSDARYSRLNRAVTDIFSAMKQLYPSILRDFPVPIGLLVEDQTRNAYALGPRADKGEVRLPYIFIVHTQVADDPSDESEYYGIIAHELAHLLLGHGRPGAREKIRKFYRAPEATEPLGFLQKNDSHLEKKVSKWLELAQRAGPFSHQALSGLPSTIGVGQYFDLLKFVRTSIADSDIEVCKMAENQYSFWFDKYLGFFSHDFQTFTIPSTSARTEFEMIGSGYIGTMSKCLEGVPPNLISIYEQQFGIPASTLEVLIKDDPAAQEDVRVFAESKNIMEGLTTLVRLKREEMREIESEIDLKHVRYYSHEEEADDVAVRVLMALGLDPMGNANWMVNWSLKNSSKLECLAILSNETVPPYGSLLDDHHSTCFRAYHSKQLIKYLSR